MNPIIRTSLCLLILLTGCAKSYDYAISEYRAEFRLKSGTGDVRVKLNIRYKVGTTEKSDGFKFVGTNGIKDVKCSDESGPIDSSIVPMRENTIEWRFAPVANGTKNVSVEFTVIGLLKNDGEVHVLKVPWAGVFRVPVSNAIYEIVLPNESNWEIITCSPGKFRIINRNGERVLLIEESPLETKELYISYRQKR